MSSTTFVTFDNRKTTVARNRITFGTFLNVLNNQKLISWDTTVTADNTGPRDENGLPLTYISAARFGQATRTSDYPRPRPGLDGGRTFLVSMGVRF